MFHQVKVKSAFKIPAVNFRAFLGRRRVRDAQKHNQRTYPRREEAQGIPSFGRGEKSLGATNRASSDHDKTAQTNDHGIREASRLHLTERSERDEERWVKHLGWRLL